MRKKASVFFWVPITLMAVSFLIIILVHTSSNLASAEHKPGFLAVRTLNAIEEGEIVDFYIREASLQLLKKSLSDAAVKGGLVEASCGEFEGYPKWNDESKLCLPDVNSLRPSIIEMQAQDLQAALDVFPDGAIPNPGYQFNLVSGEGSLKLTAVADKKIRIEITEEGNEYGFAATTLNYDIDGTTATPGQPGQPDTPTNPTLGKCGNVVDYAKRYLGCPYSFYDVAILKPEACESPGLTCATFVQSVFKYTVGNPPSGNGVDECQSGVMSMRFSELSELQPGDVFSNYWWIFGHTGIYVGRGDVSSTDNFYYICHRSYTPNPNGDYIFIHSIGNSKGDGEVCYSSHKELFTQYGGKQKLRTFCRHRECV